MWDVATGKRLIKSTGTSSYLYSVKFSSDGITLATGGSYRKVQFLGRTYRAILAEHRETRTQIYDQFGGFFS